MHTCRQRMCPRRIVVKTHTSPKISILISFFEKIKAVNLER